MKNEEFRLDRIEADLQWLSRAIVFLLIIVLCIVGVQWFSTARQDGRLDTLDEACAQLAPTKSE